jgi:hypothetical protein
VHSIRADFIVYETPGCTKLGMTDKTRTAASGCGVVTGCRDGPVGPASRTTLGISQCEPVQVGSPMTPVIYGAIFARTRAISKGLAMTNEVRRSGASATWVAAGARGGPGFWQSVCRSRVVS